MHRLRSRHRRRARGAGGLSRHRHGDQRRLRPHRLRPRPRGPGDDGRHRLLLLAGGAAPAARALRGGECSLALAGGVTVLSTPASSSSSPASAASLPTGAASPSPRPPTAPASRRGSACSSSPRLSDAEREGHPILAVLRGSAVNQDGASNGLTAPNGPSQERVIRQALANARLTPQDVDAVEAHGTGTMLGRPDRGRSPARHLRPGERGAAALGSIKSNIGHTQAAAGVAGVIKMVMAMREGRLAEDPSRRSALLQGRLGGGEDRAADRGQPWQPNGKPRRAAVSSFGDQRHQRPRDPGGSTAARRAESRAGRTQSQARAAPPTQIPLTLSAKTEPALQEAAARLASHLRGKPRAGAPRPRLLPRHDQGRSSSTAAVVLGAEHEELLGALDALAQGERVPNPGRGHAPLRAAPRLPLPRPGLPVAGDGPGAARDLTRLRRPDARPAKRRSPPTSSSPCARCSGTPGAPSLERIEVVQPALFAVMVSLAGLWRELRGAPGRCGRPLPGRDRRRPRLRRALPG